MKTILLIIRLLVEAIFGLICMMGLFLLPGIRGQMLLFIIGYLGMPRRYHPAELQHVNPTITLGGLLGVAILLLIGALCFRDVFKTIRKLRVSHHES